MSPMEATPVDGTSPSATRAPTKLHAPSKLRAIARSILGAAMIAIGALHFAAPGPFVRIMPAWLPAHLALVYVSGAAEVAGGAGLFVKRWRRAAGLGLVALYLAVFPANINMAMHRLSLNEGPPPPDWALWARLPLQALLIAWAYWASRDER